MKRQLTSVADVVDLMCELSILSERAIEMMDANADPEIWRFPFALQQELILIAGQFLGKVKKRNINHADKITCFWNEDGTCVFSLTNSPIRSRKRGDCNDF